MAKFKEFYLKESPDRVQEKFLYHHSKEAFPFGYFHGKFYFDKQGNGKTHYEMLEKFLKNGDKHIANIVKTNDNELDSSNMNFHGRLWLISKIISFWDYPDQSNFNKVISELKKHGIPINKDWKVEVYDNKQDALLDSNSKLIPIDQYGNDNKGFKADQLSHILDPIAKQAMKSNRPIPGSVHKYQKVVPKDWSIAKYNSMMKQESLEENVPTSVAPSSVETGIHAKKVGEVSKRNNPDTIYSKEEIKKKIKDKLSKKNDLSKYLKP